MTAAIIAVTGTLLGALLTGLLQQRAARTERQAAHEAALRDSRVAALTGLVSALDAHRAAMWDREHARLTGQSDERVRTLTATIRETRAAITDPHVRLRVLTDHGGLTQAAANAVTATYSLRGAESLTALSAAREAALDARENLVLAAAGGIC